MIMKFQICLILLFNNVTSEHHKVNSSRMSSELPGKNQEINRPVMHVQFQMAHGIVFQDKFLVATCTVVRPKEVIFEWNFVTQERHVEHLQCENTTQKHIDAVPTGKSLHFKSTNKISVKVDARWTGLRLACFIKDNLHSSIPSACGKHDDNCAISPGFQIKNSPDEPLPPQLHLIFSSDNNTLLVGSDLKATCTTVVRLHQVITWVVRPPDRPAFVVSDTDASWNISSTERKLKSGNLKFLKSTLLKNSITKELSGAILICFSTWLDGSESLQCADHDRSVCHSSSPLVVKQMHHVVSLTVGTHAGPTDVYKSLPLTAHCKAYVDAGGDVSWFLYYKDQRVDPLRSTADTVKIVKEAEVSQDGGIITSTMTLDMTSVNLADDRIVCTSYKTQNIGGCADKDITCKSSGPLRAIRGPQYPTLEVSYNKLPSVVYPGNSLDATCAAVVGREGAIGWALLDTKNSTIHLSGKESGIEIKETKRDKKTTEVKSSLSIKKVNQTIHGWKVQCCSFDDSNTSKRALFEKMNFCELSLTVEVEEPQGFMAIMQEKIDKIKNKGDIWSYVAAVLVMAAILSAFCFMTLFRPSRVRKHAAEKDSPERKSPPSLSSASDQSSSSHISTAPPSSSTISTNSETVTESTYNRPPPRARIMPPARNKDVSKRSSIRRPPGKGFGPGDGSHGMVPRGHSPMGNMASRGLDKSTRNSLRKAALNDVLRKGGPRR